MRYEPQTLLESLKRKSCSGEYMESLGLKELFAKLNYNWEVDKDKLEIICGLTKTRVNVPAPSSALQYGCEQTFLIKAVVDKVKSKRILEIGTGRGTAAYTMSLSPSVQEIVTLDIIPFEQRQLQAIDFKPVRVSNKDLYDRMPFDEKRKIKFIERKNFDNDTDFDLAFIDGCHTDIDIIRSDYCISKCVLDNNGVIIWDDYDPKYPVKEMVNSISDVETEMIEFRGHLFGDKIEKGVGEVIMYKKGIERWPQ